jgi:type VI secretion system secreted protein Hcp
MGVVDYFLKIDGIEGESQDSKHKNEIQLESFSWGETQTGKADIGEGMGSGRVNMGDFHFVMKTQKASPKLFLACAQGDHIKNALLTIRKAGKQQQEYLKWKFTDLLISSYQTGGSSASDVVPLDQISFNCTQVDVEYHEQKQDGTLGGAITAGYNQKTQQAS